MTKSNISYETIKDIFPINRINPNSTDNKTITLYLQKPTKKYNKYIVKFTKTDRSGPKPKYTYEHTIYIDNEPDYKDYLLTACAKYIAKFYRKGYNISIPFLANHLHINKHYDSIKHISVNSLKFTLPTGIVFCEKNHSFYVHCKYGKKTSVKSFTYGPYSIYSCVENAYNAAINYRISTIENNSKNDDIEQLFKTIADYYEIYENIK